MKKMIFVILATIMVVVLAISCRSKGEISEPYELDPVDSVISVVQNSEPNSITSFDEKIRTTRKVVIEQQVTSQKNCTISVDAKIAIPDFDSISIVQIKKKPHTHDDFLAVMRVLMSDQPIFIVDQDSFFSKEEIKDIINYLNINVNNGNMIPSVKKAALDVIPLLSEDSLSAINRNEEEEYKKNIKFYWSASSPYTLSVKSYLGKSQSARLSRCMENTEHSHCIYFENLDYMKGDYIFREVEGDYMLSNDYSLNEAIELADAILNKIGNLENMVLDSTFLGIDNSGISQSKTIDSNHVFRLYYTKAYNGNAVSFTSTQQKYYDCIGKPLAINDQYNSLYGGKLVPEGIMLLIDNGEIIQFDWVNHYEYSNLIENSPSLLDFNEILDSFEQYCNEYLSWQLTTPEYSSEDLEVEIVISEIELGYAIVNNNSENEYAFIIPVWEFIGKEVITNSDTGEIINFTTQPKESFMTLNALDGNLVSRGLMSLE